MQFPVGYKRDLGNGRWVIVKERHGKFIDLVFSNGRKILFTTDEAFITKNYEYKFNMLTNDRTGSERVQADGVSRLLICDYRNASDMDCAMVGIGLPEFYEHVSYDEYKKDLVVEETEVRRKKYRENKRRERDGDKQNLGNGYIAVCHYKTVNSCVVDIVSKDNPHEKLIEGIDMPWARFKNGAYAKRLMNEALGNVKGGKTVLNINSYIGKKIKHTKLGAVIPIRSDGKTARVIVSGGGITDVKIKDLKV